MVCITRKAAQRLRGFSRYLYEKPYFFEKYFKNFKNDPCFSRKAHYITHNWVYHI